MEQLPSWNEVSHSNLKKFVKNLCLVTSKYVDKQHYANDYNIPVEDVSTERVLNTKIQHLELELQKTKEEKDKALDENREKIDELSIALLAVKTRIGELIHYRKEKDRRLRNLEKKIIQTAK